MCVKMIRRVNDEEGIKVEWNISSRILIIVTLVFPHFDKILKVFNFSFVIFMTYEFLRADSLAFCNSL